MLLVGYCYGIRSERRLCEEVHLNLAYRWFCRLGLDGEVPDHSSSREDRQQSSSPTLMRAASSDNTEIRGEQMETLGRIARRSNRLRQAN
jgi:transposase